jgi:hypothetical protein
MNLWLSGHAKGSLKTYGAMFQRLHPEILLTFGDPDLENAIQVNLWLSGGAKSGLNSNAETLERIHAQVCLSFADPAIEKSIMDPRKLRFFLDSGAYGAWTQGTVIDEEHYKAFITHNADAIDVYAAIDVIPGQRGQIATSAERDRAADLSWEGYLRLRSEGFDPLPVYHYGEHVRHLQRIVQYLDGQKGEESSPYVGIGGLVGVSSQARRTWLDRIFADHVCDSSGHAQFRTHGFGMTSLPLIFRYPWYSVDSSSWLRTTANGAVYMPQVASGGAFRYDCTPTAIAVSDQAPDKGAKHAASLPKSAKAELERWLASCGVTLAQVAGNYYYRGIVNVTFFKRVSELKQDRVFVPPKHSQERFF